MNGGCRWDQRQPPFFIAGPVAGKGSKRGRDLEQITGADFGFPKWNGPSGPEAGLRRAKTWWEEHKGEFRD